MTNPKVNTEAMEARKIKWIYLLKTDRGRINFVWKV